MTTLAAQDETIAFLSTLDGGVRETHRTHISVVILTSGRAYKLKRAVRFPYLDFSTPERRFAMCEREAALNRRTAPDLYLGARRVTRSATGGLEFDGAGALVDAIVEMRRFDQEMLLDRLAERGALSEAHIDALARRIAAFHNSAAVFRNGGGAQEMAHLIDLSATSFDEAAPAEKEQVAALIGALRSALEKSAALVDARRDAGKVRHCHGDLTLRNICLVDDDPTPFDCLEFSDELAIIDVLYDLAFLLMDLQHAKAFALANRALNRYLDAGDETDGLALIPFFMALRATIRSHIGAAQNRMAEAQAYFALAQSCLAPQTPRLIAVGGLSGSGKSSLAARLAPAIGAAPGARVLNSDRLRKQLFGAAPNERLPREAYTPEASQRVYARLYEEAARALGQGWPVIADAVFDRVEDRAAIERVARAANVGFDGVWLDADITQRVARVEARRSDVSDATRAVVELQSGRDPGAIRWRRIDAARGIDAVAQDARHALCD